MSTTHDVNGLAIPSTISLSQREREFTLRLLNKEINSDIKNEALINHISNNIEILTNRANCDFLSPLRSVGGKLAPRKLIIESIKSECISETNFNWIDTKNDRLCNYIWSYIRSLTIYPVVSPSTIDVGVRIDGAFEVTSSTHVYNAWSIDPYPTNNVSKKNASSLFLISSMRLTCKKRWILKF